MKAIEVKKGGIICRKGDKADSMFFIKKGKIGVFLDYGTPTESELTILGKGKYFGEMGVIDQEPRSADCVALAASELVEVTTDEFASFISDNSSDVIEIMANMSKAIRKTTAMYKKASKVVEDYVYSGETSQASVQEEMEEIGKNSRNIFARSIVRKNSLVKSSYLPGEIIFKQGEKGNNMFLVLEGEVTFYLNYGKKNQIELATNSKGAIFGEMAVIEEEKRTATAVAKTGVRLRPVANTEFASFIEEHPTDAIKILKSLSGKLRSTTNNYVNVLKTIHQFVMEERDNCDAYSEWSSFTAFSDVYTSGMFLHF